VPSTRVKGVFSGTSMFSRSQKTSRTSDRCFCDTGQLLCYTDLELLKEFSQACGHVVERAHHANERVVDGLVGQLWVDRRVREQRQVPVADQSPGRNRSWYI